MSFGIAFAQQNRSMQDRNWQYDTNRPKLTVDPREGFLAVFEQLGGTEWSLAPGDSKVEILFQLQHNMPWPPEFLCYFYIEDAPSDHASSVNRYSSDMAFMATDSVILQEAIAASVDDDYFYIKHFASIPSFSLGGDQTAYGSQYKFRIRYEIMDHPAVYTGQGVGSS